MNRKNGGFGDRVYVVTGSTQGVGEAIAVSLAEAGAAGLVICGRNEANGGRVKAALEQAGARAEYVVADLENPEDCRRIVATCDERFGRIDGLVNAAGLTDRGTIDDT